MPVKWLQGWLVGEVDGHRTVIIEECLQTKMAKGCFASSTQISNILQYLKIMSQLWLKHITILCTVREKDFKKNKS